MQHKIWKNLHVNPIQNCVNVYTTRYASCNQCSENRLNHKIGWGLNPKITKSWDVHK